MGIRLSSNLVRIRIAYAKVVSTLAGSLRCLDILLTALVNGQLVYGHIEKDWSKTVHVRTVLWCRQAVSPLPTAYSVGMPPPIRSLASVCILALTVPGSVRLSRGDYGILEIYHNGSWGTVCDDVFEDNNNAARYVYLLVSVLGSVFVNISKILELTEGC